MICLVFRSLHVLNCLGIVLIQVLLLLVQLVDNLILAGNFIIEEPNSMIPVGLFLLQLLNGNFKVLDVLLNDIILLFESLLVSTSLLPGLLHGSQSISSSLELNLQVSLLSTCLSLPLSVLSHVALLFLNLRKDSLGFSFNVLVFFQQPFLSVKLILV